MKKLIMGALVASAAFVSYATAASADVVSIRRAQLTSGEWVITFTNDDRTYTRVRGTATETYAQTLNRAINQVGSIDAVTRATTAAALEWEEGDENDIAIDAARDLFPTNASDAVSVPNTHNTGYDVSVQALIENRINGVTSSDGTNEWAQTTILLLDDQLAGIDLWDTLDTILDEVWLDGYDNGYNDGFVAGFDAGVAHGINLVNNQ